MPQAHCIPLGLKCVFTKCYVLQILLYLQYPVFDGIEGICWYSKFDLRVSIWLHEGIAIPLNTTKYYMGTSLKEN